MSAAICAASHGATVTLLDEQPTAGGQIYRGLSNGDTRIAGLLGKDYQYGKKLTDQLARTTVQHLTNTTVWSVDENAVITYSKDYRAYRIAAKVVIIATGALERPYPIPGWTLPGVMTAGAAQILLKTSGIVPEQPVLAGTGPLLYTVASQLLGAGVKITAVVDTVTSKNHLRAAKQFPITTPGPLLTGLSYLKKIKRTHTPYYKGATQLKITGDRSANGIEFQHKGKVVSLRSNCILLHQGVIPNTQLSRSLRLEHHWHSLQQCFHPSIDQWGKSSLDNIRIAGDAAKIGGAIIAEHHGTITALGALADIEKITEQTRDKLAALPLAAIHRLDRLRHFLDALYAPPVHYAEPTDDTIICRCEEVTAGDIRRYAKLGCVGPNQTKSFGRCGMGPCQGRYCSLTVTEILAAENKLSQDEVGAYRIRSPVKPVTLEELASLHE